MLHKYIRIKKLIYYLKAFQKSMNSEGRLQMVTLTLYVKNTIFTEPK